MKMSEEQVASANAAVAAMLPTGTMPIGFVMGVTYLDEDGDVSMSIFHHGLQLIERLGVTRAMALKIENELPWNYKGDD
jgi:hypothetical protein